MNLIDVIKLLKRCYWVTVFVSLGGGIVNAACDPRWLASNGGLCVRMGKAHSAFPKKADFDSNCGETIELDKTGSMKFVRLPKAQGGGICYAQTAMQMVEAFWFSHGDPRAVEQLSPTVLALGARIMGNKRWPSETKNTLYAGFVCDAAYYALNRQHQDHRRASELFGGPELKAFIDGMPRSNSDSEWLDQRGEFMNGPEEKQTHRDLIGGEACRINQLQFATGTIPLPSILMGIFQKPLAAYTTGRALRKTDVSPKCVDRWRGWSRSQGWSNAKFISDSIHKLLAIKPDPQPVGISFCSEVLRTGPSYVGLGDRGAAKDCAAHAAVIVGQRRDPATGKCQFKVRDTIERCDYYEWCIDKPHPIAEGSKILTCAKNRWDCESGRGTVWVDAEALSNNIYGLHSLVVE